VSTPYPYPASAPGYAPAAVSDPTAVMGRRIGAIIVDFLLYLLIMSVVGPTPLSPLAEYYEVADGTSMSEACDDVDELEDNVAGCALLGDRVYFTTTTDAGIQIGTWIVVVGLYSWLQGATGFTPGKRLFGLKAVNEQGEAPGFGKSLARTVLWVVDAFPYCLPLVGLITGLSTKGHRRVGDMAAKTFVVDRAHTGPVVVPGLVTAASAGYPAPGAVGGPPWGAPPGPGGPPGWGAPPNQPPQSTRPSTPSSQQPVWGAPPGAGTPAGPRPQGVTGPPAGWPGASGPSGGGAPHRPSPPGGTPTPGRPADQSSPGRPADEGPAGPSGWAAPGESGAASSGSASSPGGGPPGRAAPGSLGGGAPAAPGSLGSGAPASGASGSSATPRDADTSGPGGTAAGGAAADQTSSGGYNPQWDAARGTYIVWEPNRRQWLGWDDTAKEWKPL
jgi:uncharacterized RDD family membrane protein YckC